MQQFYLSVGHFSVELVWPMTEGNHSTLYITRLRYMATEFYKCMNSLNPTYLQDMVTTINTEYTLRNPKPVQQP